MFSAITSALLISLTPHVGMSDSQLNWDIAGGLSDKASPNILSELEFEDIRSIDAGVTLDIIRPLRNDLAFRVEADYTRSFIQDGRVQDSDYLGNDRTLEFSRSYSELAGEHATQGKVAMGFMVPVDRDVLFSVLVGRSSYDQKMNMRKGQQAVLAFAGPGDLEQVNLALQNLNSAYEASWSSYWVGLEAQYAFRYGQLKLRYEHHDTEYHGIGSWNLRTDLAYPKSFEHKASGKGRLYELAYLYPFSKTWLLGTSLFYQQWTTDSGIDLVHTAAGDTLATRLNGAEWKTKGAKINLTYRF